jgi:ABC-type lipoprotein export system ATPase subunit
VASALPDAAPPLVAVRDVAGTFGRGDTAVHALRGVSFTIRAGQLVTVRGRSGSGKITLLNIVGGLDSPITGVTVHSRSRTADGAQWSWIRTPRMFLPSSRSW